MYALEIKLSKTCYADILEQKTLTVIPPPLKDAAASPGSWKFVDSTTLNGPRKPWTLSSYE